MENSKQPAPVRIRRHLRNRLISGLLVLTPLAITLFILKFILSALTAFVLPLLRPWLAGVPEPVLFLLAVAIALLMIYLVGQFTTHFVGRRLIQAGENLMLKLPIARSVYSASKQVIDTFSVSTKAAFTATVLVEFPHPGSRAVGFITGTILDPGGRTMYRVFVATTPNPTSGFLLLLPEEAVTFTDISVEDGIKMIVSGGMLAPKSYTRRNSPLPAGASGASPADAQQE